MTDWIKVEDRLPPPDENLGYGNSTYGFLTESGNVLASDGLRVFVARLTRSEEGETIWRHWGRDADDIDGKVTHWRPLPELPEDMR